MKSIISNFKQVKYFINRINIIILLSELKLIDINIYETKLIIGWWLYYRLKIDYIII